MSRLSPSKDPEVQKARRNFRARKYAEARSAEQAAHVLAYQIAYRKKHKEKLRLYHAGLNGRKRGLMRRYKLTLAEYDAMLDKQNGLCAICSQPPYEGAVLGVDHDHETGELRGLLCNNCNRGLGYLKDKPAFLRRAADYIEEFK